MSSEIKTETAQGGCLDGLVRAITLGKFGVETTVFYKKQIVVPTEIVLRQEDPSLGPLSPVAIAMRTGESVRINNFGSVNTEKTEIRIVKNKHPKADLPR